MNTKTFLAFDVETTGPDPLLHRVNGIGACLMSVDLDIGNISVLGTMQTGLPAKFPEDFDDYCVAHFWNHNKKALHYLESITSKEENATVIALNAFNKFVASCYTKYPDMRIISNNPGFDGARIAVEFSRHKIGLPLEYKRWLDGEGNIVYEENGLRIHRRIVSSNDVSNGAIMAQHNQPYREWYSIEQLGLGLKNPYSHDHTPLNDALQIAWNHCTILHQVQKSKT
jgi:nuclear transport factor 2 (NTF2) superfamily protein